MNAITRDAEGNRRASPSSAAIVSALDSDAPDSAAFVDVEPSLAGTLAGISAERVINCRNLQRPPLAGQAVQKRVRATLR